MKPMKTFCDCSQCGNVFAVWNTVPTLPICGSCFKGQETMQYQPKETAMMNDQIVATRLIEASFYSTHVAGLRAKWAQAYTDYVATVTYTTAHPYEGAENNVRRDKLKLDIAADRLAFAIEVEALATRRAHDPLTAYTA